MITNFLGLYEQGQRFVVFDVETVGASDATTIVEIGAVEAGKDYHENYRHFHKILRFEPPSWRPYWRSLKVHKIPPEEIENGEDREETLRQFCEFASGATLICHTSFDVRMMRQNLQNHEMEDCLASFATEGYIDSCRLARAICPDLESFSLASLVEHFQLCNPQAHRALSDALTTKRVVAKLLQHHYSQQ